MKKLLIAIVLAVILVNCFHSVVDSASGLNIVMADDMLSPLESMVVISVLAAVFAVIGVVVALSVFGALVIAGIAGVLALLVAGIGVFWPVLLIVAGILLFKNAQQNTAN